VKTENFLHNPANKQTNTDEITTSFTEVIMKCKVTECNCGVHKGPTTQNNTLLVRASVLTD